MGDSFFGVFVSVFTEAADSCLSGCGFGFSSDFDAGLAANIVDTGFFCAIGVDASALTFTASGFTIGILIGKTIDKKIIALCRERNKFANHLYRLWFVLPMEV